MASTSAPATNSGNRGPGTFETVRLYIRGLAASRAARSLRNPGSCPTVRRSASLPAMRPERFSSEVWAWIQVEAGGRVGLVERQIHERERDLIAASGGLL